MIKRLKLSNFRLHEDTELRFDDNNQLLLIAGANGSGKSSLLEAVSFALYGESRHGARYLNRLIRRGAEIEGAVVEVDFEVDGTLYSVTRKRTPSATTAVLHGDGAPLVESSSAVTTEVERILGMDAAGFHLAVVARQKELDGLASLTPADRARMISRLLRLDAVRVARQSAHDQYRHIKAAVKNLGPAPDINAAEQARDDANTNLQAATAGLSDAETALAELDTELEDTADVETRWQQASNALARAEGQHDAATSDVTRLTEQLDDLQIPDAPDTDVRTLDDIQADLGQLDQQIARAEQAHETQQHLDVIAEDHQQAVAELDRIGAWLTTNGDTDQINSQIVDAEDALQQAQQQLDDARQQLREASDREAVASAELQRLQQTRHDTDELGGTCDRCGQNVDENHLEQLQEELDKELTHVQQQLDDAKTARQQAEDDRDTAKQAVEAATKTHTELSRQLEKARELVSRRTELSRKADVYAGQLSRAPQQLPDLDELYDRRTDLVTEAATAREVQTKQAAHDEAVARRNQLADDLARAEARADQAAKAVAEAKPDAKLEKAYQRRAELAAQRRDEAELVASLRTETAVAREKLDRAQANLEEATDRAERRRNLVGNAQTQVAARDLLEELHHRLQVKVRPALEGAVSELLARMSQGRFTRVRFTERYDLQIFDTAGDLHTTNQRTETNQNQDDQDDDAAAADAQAGTWQPLDEFSGGEIDLIALAVRLALAGVVSERQGRGGPGWLILDECLGSQDPARRTAILDALRQLRNRYGQIFIISHVPGIGDDVDAVLDVTVDETRTAATVDII